MISRVSAMLFLACSLAFTSTLGADLQPLPSSNLDAHPFSSSTESQRFQSLTKEIRCVVCQNQNIADSNAPLANDLREKVYQMIANKKPNEEIKTYLVKRYGEFILLQPRFNKLTLFLWLFPLVGVGLGLFLLINSRIGRVD